MASPIVQLSLSYPFFKIAQILFAVLVLGLSAYIVHYSSGSASIMSVVAVSSSPHLAFQRPVLSLVE